MNTLELFSKLHKCKSFIGVYPRDVLPKIFKYPSSIVINTDKSTGEGEHWVAVYFDENKFGEYFDSYGLPPLHEDIINFLVLNAPCGFVYNKITFQCMLSTVCGWYCVLFIKMKCRGYSFCDILALFQNNCTKNDSRVKYIGSKFDC